MIALASDHAGLALKNEIRDFFDSEGIEYADLGAFTADSCDYPAYAETAARMVASGGASLGVLVCGTGLGMAMAAGKVNGIRAAACSDCFSAKAARSHNDANILCIGARVVGAGLALELVKAFLGTEFIGGRHQRRVDMITDIENRR